MLTNKEIESITNKVSKAIGSKVYFFKEVDEDKPIYEDNQRNFYRLSVKNEIYTLVIEDTLPMSLREISLIKSLIEEVVGTEKYIASNIKEKDLLRAFNEELDKDTLEYIIKSLGLGIEQEIIVILVKLYGNSENNEISTLIKNITSKHLVNVITENGLMTIVYQHSLEEGIDLAKKIVNTVETELFSKIRIGVSTLRSPYELRIAYKEGLEALKIGIKWELPSNFFLFEDLLMFRLISYLPKVSKSKLFHEALDSGLNQLTPEEIKTAKYFIDSNLNISESARQLYIHRNTLIYRLDKIHKETGFNIRIFNDALRFKILLAIYRYINNKVK